MFVLQSHITIGNYSFSSPHAVRITKSVDALSDSCMITLPTNFTVRSSGEEQYTEDAIKVGDKVSVTLGYKDISEKIEFEGYVRKIKPTIPLQIECEDAIYLLRQNTINWQKEKTSLKEVLEQAVKGTGVSLSKDIPTMALDKWVIQHANGAQVLEGIRKELLMTAFIDDAGALYCGLSQNTNIGETVTYDLNRNIIKNNLEYRSSEDRRLKIAYKYKAKDNTEKVVVVGDIDGELRTFHTSVVSDKTQLKAMATAELEKLKYDGFDGTILSFLEPYATRGMKAIIKDTKHKKREGDYFIEKVVIDYGLGGARRTVTLGRKI